MSATHAAWVGTWIAFGETNTVLALAVTCIVCAAVAGLVLGGVAAMQRNSVGLPLLGPRARMIAATTTAILGAVSLGLMVDLMAIGRPDLMVSVGLYVGAMLTFIGVNLSQARVQGEPEKAGAGVHERRRAA